MPEKDNVEREIEDVIVRFSIDTNKFWKISQKENPTIVDDVFYCFADISKYTKISLNRIYEKLDDKLNNHLSQDIKLGKLPWNEFLSYVYKFAPKKDNLVYLIISGNGDEDYSVIYKGELSEVVKVLFEGVPLGNGGDFIIVPMHYDWLIYYQDEKERLRYVSDMIM